MNLFRRLETPLRIPAAATQTHPRQKICHRRLRDDGSANGATKVREIFESVTFSSMKS